MFFRSKLLSFEAVFGRALSLLPDSPPIAGDAVDAATGRRHPLDALFDTAGRLPILGRHLSLEEKATDSRLTHGNEIELLTTGPDCWEAMLAAVRDAGDTINLESYIFDDDAFGRGMTDLMLMKQRQGVQCNVIYDALGSRRTGRAFFDRLRSAGVRVAEYNPLRWHRPGAFNHRDHRKLLIVDGQAAFTGGVNISDAFSNSSFFVGDRQRLRGHPPAWRDSHVKVVGPAAGGFQKLFLETWTRQTGEVLYDRDYFPPAPASGPHMARVIATTQGESEGLYQAFISAVHHARQSIHWTSAFFAPNPAMVDALCAAARRGVDVCLLLPGFGEDGLVLHAKHSYYQRLLDAGVRIHERDDCMMHAKTLVVDGVWSSIGSANLDTRSFLHNDEANLVVLGGEFGAQMEQVFARDLAQGRPIEAAAWASRPLKQRARERFARLFSYWL